MAEEQQKLGDEFAAITNQARDVDADALAVLVGPKPANQVATEVLDPAQAWASIPATVGSILCMALPELKDAYKPQACAEWGKAMHRLAVKRGWSTDGLPAEVDVALASAIFVIPTALAIKVRRDQAAAVKRAQQLHEQGAAGGVIPQNPGGLEGAQAAGG